MSLTAAVLRTKGWRVFNLVVTYHNDVTESSAGVRVDLDEVRKGFQHIAPKARRIIEQGSNWMRWVLCDRDPIENWVDGRVALLGDAAHPMLQYMAQGACMALEDAVCLSHVVTNRPHDVASRCRTINVIALRGQPACR
jgi:2-polyprenyl-6-methoxyphenol hydroxylase-like FAD-dependent oxidoreductase